MKMNLPSEQTELDALTTKQSSCESDNKTAEVVYVKQEPQTSPRKRQKFVPEDTTFTKTRKKLDLSDDEEKRVFKTPLKKKKKEETVKMT